MGLKLSSVERAFCSDLVSCSILVFLATVRRKVCCRLVLVAYGSPPVIGLWWANDLPVSMLETWLVKISFLSREPSVRWPVLRILAYEYLL